MTMTKHADLEGNEKLVVACIAAGENTIMEIKPQLGKSQLETLSEIRSEPSMKNITVCNKCLERLTFLFDGRCPMSECPVCLSSCNVSQPPQLSPYLLLRIAISDAPSYKSKLGGP